MGKRTKKRGGFPFFKSDDKSIIAEQATKIIQDLNDIPLARNELEEAKKRVLETWNKCSVSKQLSREQLSKEQTLNDIIINFYYGNFPLEALTQLTLIIKNIVEVLQKTNFSLSLYCENPQDSQSSNACNPASERDKKVFNFIKLKNDITQLFQSTIKPSKILKHGLNTVFSIIKGIATNRYAFLNIKQDAAEGEWKEQKIGNIIIALTTLKDNVSKLPQIQGLSRGNEELKQLIEKIINFLNIFISTNIEICARNDAALITINQELTNLAQEEARLLLLSDKQGGGLATKHTRRNRRNRRKKRKRKYTRRL